MTTRPGEEIDIPQVSHWNDYFSLLQHYYIIQISLDLKIEEVSVSLEKRQVIL